MTSEAGAIEENFANVQHHHTIGVKGVEESTGEIINADEAALVDDAFKWLTKGYQGSLTKRSIFRGSNLSEVEDFAHDVLLLIGNRNFCRHVVASSQITAIELFRISPYGRIPLNQAFRYISSI